jgi:hypothetical protein
VFSHRSSRAHCQQDHVEKSTIPTWIMRQVLTRRNLTWIFQLYGSYWYFASHGAYKMWYLERRECYPTTCQWVQSKLLIEVWSATLWLLAHRWGVGGAWYFYCLVKYGAICPSLYTSSHSVLVKWTEDNNRVITYWIPEQWKKIEQENLLTIKYVLKVATVYVMNHNPVRAKAARGW